MAQQRFEVKQTGFDQWRLSDESAASLTEGEVRLAVDFFAFTANNMTYAAAGDMLGYWKFFPVAGEGGFGVIPVWGFATVTESLCEELPVGERLYGYFPPADELVIKPAQVSGSALFDATEHRQALPPLYNRYQRVGAASEQSRGPEMLQALLGPLYMTGYCLWDMIAENGYYGASQIVVVSASSKTSLGLAQALTDDDNAPATVGLTSGRNVAFVEKTGLYTSALAYDDVDSLVQETTVVVDMAGNPATAAALRSRLGDKLAKYVNVGLTHWDAAATGAGEGGEDAEFFFAPSYILERSASLADFNHLAQAFVASGAAKASGWLTVENVQGLEAFSGRYPAICAGDMDPSTGLICAL